LNEAITMYPQLARKVTYDPDDTSSIIYHLNPNARLWDGSGVTSRDVKATFEAILNKGPMYIRSYLSDIKDIQIINYQKVNFVFESAE
ncbi:ABC transporter substrate-binding protein, partial [Psychrobacter proteolyticus]|uniref:ABC transporter substrate-binding protein n=1 Tax=Psychrobacter proteolyticus TaxID=147825 RepID=UPI00311EE367